MYKRGQVTAFIILGIVIISIVGVTLYLKFYHSLSLFKTGAEKPIVTSESAKLAFTQIENCINQQVLESFYYIYNHGGYYDVPRERALQLNVGPFIIDFIPYYYFENKKVVPNINIVIGELRKAISKNVKTCSSLDVVKQYNVKIGNVSNISIDFNEEFAEVNFNYPFSLSKDGIIFNKKEFKVPINSNIPKILYFSNNIVNEYSKKPGYLCLDCLQDLNSLTQLSLNIADGREAFYYTNGALWFFINEKNNKLNLTWIFIMENQND